MKIIYLALGSNLGDREKNIQRALELLEENQIHILRCSSVLETEPVGGPPQGKFLNAVVEAKTALSPFEVLKSIKSIENSLGRIRTGLNTPRTIDIDILIYDNVMVVTPELVIPHPRMLNREFVMTPLREIAPNLVKELSHAGH